MRILFIGGTGNISSECADYLHGQGHQVFIATRGRNPAPPQFTAITVDRKDPAALKRVAVETKADVAIDFIGYELADVQADYAAFAGRVGQYVFISSTTVHARPARLPITEDAPIGNSSWEYARKKADCEQWLFEKYRSEGFPVTVVRPSHTYSRRWIPNAISSSNHTFASRLKAGRPVFVHDDGETPWTLTAASDFASGLAGLLGAESALGEALHITSDETLTWNQIYRQIADALGVQEPRIVKIPTDFICKVAPSLTGTLKGDKAHPGVFDNSKLRRVVPGFKCRKSFAQGIRDSVDWLNEDPRRWRIDPATDALIENVLGSWAKQNGGPF